MNLVRDVIYRLRQGDGSRAIARDLQLSRNTVAKYRAQAAGAGYLDPDVPLPDAPQLVVAEPTPVAHTPSTVAPYQAVVEQYLAQGVEVQTIWDRLRDQQGYGGSYASVWRFVQRLRPAVPDVTVRVQTAPGQEAQVDFGAAGQLCDPRSGQLRTASVFVLTLSYSRHQYAELVLDQTVPTWLACHRHAFAAFGGVPQRLVPDNLKAAVLVAALHDPVLGDAYRRLAQHYGCLISPTRPRTPQHKGKVENGVHFVKRSFLATLATTDLREANRQLAHWVQERAGTRDHGTTHQAPLALFRAEEQAALLPLPAEPFELTETRCGTVQRDCHVVIDGSYYSVPHQYVRQRLDICLFERVVQLYAGATLVATHVRASRKGSWQTRLDHYPREKAAYLTQTPPVCRAQAQTIGPQTSALIEQLLAERPLDRLPAVQALLRLQPKVGSPRLEAACRRALAYGDPRYRRVKDILSAGLESAPLPEPELPTPTQFAFQRGAAEFFGAEAVGC